MVVDFPGTFPTAQAALDITSGKMTFHREDQITGKENVDAQNQRH